MPEMQLISDNQKLLDALENCKSVISRCVNRLEHDNPGIRPNTYLHQDLKKELVKLDQFELSKNSNQI